MALLRTLAMAMLLQLFTCSGLGLLKQQTTVLVQDATMQGKVGIKPAARIRSIKDAPYDFMEDPPLPKITCSDLEVAVDREFGEMVHQSWRRDQLIRALHNCRDGSSFREFAEAASRTVTIAPRINLSKPIEYLHVSKTAGTYFCKCARFAGLNNEYVGTAADVARAECHYLDEDHPVWSSREGAVGKRTLLGDDDLHSISCAARLGEYKQHRIEVEGNENYMASYGLCEEFTNLIFFRDPTSRMISHLLEVLKHPPFDLSADEPVKKLQSMTLDDVISNWPEVTNNFYIRSLLGFEVFKLPSQQINEAHLRRAKQVLSAFDHVILTSDAINKDVYDAVGLDCSDADGHHHEKDMGYTTDEVAGLLEKAWGQKEWARLKEMNHLDFELFQHSLLLRFIS